MSERPDVSVIIPVHDAGSTVARLVSSILAVESVRVEVVVVDDASTDDSLARVLALDAPQVVVDGFPTTVTGKIVRRELRSLALSLPAQEAADAR